MPEQTSLKGIENGRAEAAFNYASVGKKIATKVELKKGEIEKIIIGEKSKENCIYGDKFFEDDKYSSYVKKIPMLIKTNGIGSTFAFVKSKFKKEKDKKDPGTEHNTKNAYDLIYIQTQDWLRKKGLVKDNGDLIETLISSETTSSDYRRITNEVLALYNWLRRFAEGEEED